MAKTKFTQELFDDICQAIATSENGIAKICKNAGIAMQTFYNWMGDDKDLLERYARAKDAQLQLMVEQILTISDDGLNDVMEDAEGNIRVNYDHIQRSKLRVDTRKWLLSKLKPKVYGDKVDLTSGGEKIQQTIIWGGKEIKI